jgi:hypothetical protein
VTNGNIVNGFPSPFGTSGSELIPPSLRKDSMEPRKFGFEFFEFKF